MYLVNNITADPLQNIAMTLPDGTVISAQLYFVQQQYGWFLNYLKYGAFTLNGTRITNSPNMLHQFRNILPFGMSCYSLNDREPMLVQDFSSGASSLYILTPAEVEAYSEFLNV